MKYLFTLLTVLFVALKLCHVIDWSWWLVFTPTFVGVGMWVVFVGILLACAAGSVWADAGNDLKPARSW